MKIKSLFTIFSALLFLSCATVPLTGRKQVALLPESQLMNMGVTSYNQFLSENKVMNASSSNDAQMIQRVGNNIAKAVEAYLSEQGLSKRVEGYKWEFNLVNDATVNAWCMPGGKVVFYSGILPICQDEEGIAVVMGHEIAHAIARHGNERMSQGLLAQAGGVGLEIYMADHSEETKSLLRTAYGVGAQVGVMLPFSRKHESEADHLGLMFSAMAGYNPQVAPAFWERMNALSSTRPPEFLSTHPHPEKRSSNLKKWMPEAMEFYNASKSN
jgi:predicted Zn-dependent protease